jgi:DNA polymerase
MKRLVFVDFETRSLRELRGQTSVGLSNYTMDASTEAIILAWALDNEEPNVYFPLWQVMPEELKKALEDSSVDIVAYNSAFERNVFLYVLGIDLPVSRFQDPQPSARYLSLPGSLEDVGGILKLPDELKKDKEGKRLLDVFTKPTKKKGKESYFRDWDSDPEDWQRFVEYAKQDIRAEREILKRLEALGTYPLLPRERDIWELDQKINGRGIPVDRPFVTSMFNLGERAKKDAIGELKRLTGLENANSNSQMLQWAKKEGYSKQSLRKETVLAELKFNTELTPLCRQVLELRKAASSTSYKKMAALLRLSSSDQRLRNQFLYLGSPRCGRWSGNGFQFHNMARPTQDFEDLETVDEARRLVSAEDYQGVIAKFGKHPKDYGAVLGVVKSCIRTAFCS